MLEFLRRNLKSYNEDTKAKVRTKKDNSMLEFLRRNLKSYNEDTKAKVRTKKENSMHIFPWWDLTWSTARR